MHVAVFVPFVSNLGIEEGIIRDSGSRHFFTDQNKISLINVWDSMPVVHGKPCVCNLILVPAGMGATVIQGIAVLVTYKCKGEKVSRIDQFLGISGITDKNIDNIFAP